MAHNGVVKIVSVTDRSQINRVQQHTSELDERVDSLEIMVHSLYRLLRKNGISEEELKREIDIITPLHMKFKKATLEYHCPKCGKIMQVGNLDGNMANCMYCGTKITLSPMDRYNLIDQEIDNLQNTDESNGDIIVDEFSDLADI